MKFKKYTKFAALALAVSVCAADVSGTGALAFAKARDVTQGNAQKAEGLEEGVEPFQIEREGGPLQDLAGQAEEASLAEVAFAEMLQDYGMYGVLANDVDFPVYQEASSESGIVKVLSSGYQVKLTGVALSEAGLWFQIGFAVDDVEYSGYIQREYVVTQDARLAEWEGQYLSGGIQTSRRGSARGSTVLSSFPKSYQSFIEKLIQAHPNWTFVPMNTNLEWEEVLENEMVDARNLVETYQPDTWKSTDPKDYNMETGEWVIKNGTNWVQASESIVKHYLDPRNFLNEESVFQFEQLTYNTYHTESGVEKILSGTFMANKKLEDGSGDGVTYAQAFLKIGKELKVSPYFLASRVRQEQGVSGTSSLISGTYPGYKGYYNYFNMGATGIGTEVIISGLTEAKNAGWDTRYKALLGGAEKVSSRYIARGQDTFYLQKFDVDPSYDGLYWHQYMQNLLAADSEGKSVQRSYSAMGALDNGFVFKVPVYNNMPSSPCPKPQETLAKPSLTAVKNGYQSVKLSWKEVASAESYQVYRAEGADGKYSKVKTTSSLSYEDKSVEPGKQYSYKVRAFKKFSDGNRYSSYSAVKTIDLTVPATSWNAFKVKSYSSVELSWEKKSVDGYQIYRKTNSGEYSHIKTLAGSGSCSYIDGTVTPNNAYSYKIRGFVMVNGKNYYSVYTAIKNAELSMAKPEATKASVSGGTKVKVTWKRDSKASGYYVYRATSKNGAYKKVKDITSNKTVSWSDSEISTGKTYYYKIRAYVKSSIGTKTSAYSNVVSVKTALKKPVLTVSASKKKVTLNWQKDGNAAGYKIYRATSKNGKYKEMKKITKASTVKWTDKSTKAGKKYYYKIRAYAVNKGKIKYSAYSVKKSVRAK